MENPADGNYVVRAFGLRVGVLGLGLAELEALRRRFPPAWEFRPVDPPLPRVSRWFAPTPSPPAGSPRAALERRIDGLGQRIQAFISEYAKTHVLVHAGVVAIEGRAIILPGMSGSGKSTLVSHLVREGATYLSDEYAAIDSLGLIHPYPRPIALRPSSGHSPVRRAKTAGEVIATAPLPAGLILETEYRPGARFRPRALRPLEVIGALSRNSVASRHRPEAALSAFCRVAGDARGFAGPRGTPEAVLRWLRVTLQRP